MDTIFTFAAQYNRTHRLKKCNFLMKNETQQLWKHENAELLYVVICHMDEIKSIREILKLVWLFSFRMNWPLILNEFKTRATKHCIYIYSKSKQFLSLCARNWIKSRMDICRKQKASAALHEKTKIIRRHRRRPDVI